jgi:hypothetical protein
MVHSYHGTRDYGGAQGGWNAIKDAIESAEGQQDWTTEEGWTEVEFATIGDYEAVKLSRGDKIYLSGTSGSVGIVHYQTATEEAQDPKTYAADASSGVFRIEITKSYYNKTFGEGNYDEHITVLKQ